MTRDRVIVRWEKGKAPRRERDELAQEEPLEIRVENRPIAVTMRTPGHDEELAAGFLLTEGLIRRREDILRIAPNPRNSDRNVIGVFLADGVEIDFQLLTRHTFASSSCGLCGKASIESIHQNFPPVRTRMKMDAEILLTLPDELRRHQATFAKTGGLHAAGIFDGSGKLLILREDVGRHNAVDKAIGRCLLDGLMPCDKNILVVSGRASFEIMQKALAARIAIVVAVSAPSSLAVEFAVASRQTLAGFVRGERMNVYAGTSRIVFRQK